MKRIIPLVLLAAGLSVGLGLRSKSGDHAKAAEGGSPMLKAVVRINFTDSERQKHGLKNVTNILKEEKEVEVEFVSLGGGIGLLVKDQTDYTDEGTQLIKQGVRFAACENKLWDKSMPRENLLPDVTTVPSDAVDVIRKQQQGFGYFKP